MKKNATAQNFLLTVVFLFGIANTVFAQTATVVFFPEQVIQGEPFMVQVNAKTPSAVKKITFDGKALGVFVYKGKPTALVGIDLNKKPGQYKLVASLVDGQVLETDITVGERKKIEVTFTIPAKLGGNTAVSQNKLVSTLADENKSLAEIRTGTKAFWETAFIEPLKQVFITDEYGYSRTTGAYTIPHKGVDYRAKEGTEVMAMNRGVVRIVKTYRNYGKTIVIDHGLGVMSFYLHLSKIKVREGALVQKGQVIGLSGQTGYAEAPHLHLSVRISNVSVDPVKFMGLFR